MLSSVIEERTVIPHQPEAGPYDPQKRSPTEVIFEMCFERKAEICQVKKGMENTLAHRRVSTKVWIILQLGKIPYIYTFLTYTQLNTTPPLKRMK